MNWNLFVVWTIYLSGFTFLVFGSLGVLRVMNGQSRWKEMMDWFATRVFLSALTVGVVWAVWFDFPVIGPLVPLISLVFSNGLAYLIYNEQLAAVKKDENARSYWQALGMLVSGIYWAMAGWFVINYNQLPLIHTQPTLGESLVITFILTVMHNCAALSIAITVAHMPESKKLLKREKLVFQLRKGLGQIIRAARTHLKPATLSAADLLELIDKIPIWYPMEVNYAQPIGQVISEAKRQFCSAPTSLLIDSAIGESLGIRGREPVRIGLIPLQECRLTLLQLNGAMKKVGYRLANASEFLSLLINCQQEPDLRDCQLVGLGVEGSEDNSVYLWAMQDRGLGNYGLWNLEVSVGGQLESETAKQMVAVVKDDK